MRHQHIWSFILIQRFSEVWHFKLTLAESHTLQTKTSHARKGHFRKHFSLSWFPDGVGRERWEVCGRSWWLSLCSFPLFRPVDGASRDRKLLLTPTGRCLNLWVLIEAGCVLPRCFPPSLSHHTPNVDNSHFNCVSGADREHLGHLLIIVRGCTIQWSLGYS